MNRVEVFYIKDEIEVEEAVNDYCRTNSLKPISISISYSQQKNLWVVALVVECEDMYR